MGTSKIKCAEGIVGEILHTIYTWFLIDSSLDKTKTCEPDCHNHIRASGREKTEKTHALRRRCDIHRPGPPSELKTRSIERLLGCGCMTRLTRADGHRAGADLRYPTHRHGGTIPPSSHAGGAWRAIQHALRVEEDPHGRKTTQDACYGVWA